MHPLVYGSRFSLLALLEPFGLVGMWVTPRGFRSEDLAIVYQDMIDGTGGCSCPLPPGTLTMADNCRTHPNADVYTGCHQGGWHRAAIFATRLGDSLYLAPLR